MKKNNIGIVGHVDHGKTTLTACLSNMLDETKKDLKTVQEIINEDRVIKITAPVEIPLIQWDFKSGKQSRRERRAKQRKGKRKGENN